MTAALEGAVELLERSLSYTRVALADVRPDRLDLATPCAGWTLADLLAHMEDALDAFTEAAAGRVEVRAVPPTTTRVEALRDKACALLGAWSSRCPPQGDVAVGDLGLDAPLLVATAALEITVHGWDVGQATGRAAPVPDDLARGLLSVAQHVVHAADRGPRFAGPRPVRADAPPGVRLLAWLGRAPHLRTAPSAASARLTEPAPANTDEPGARSGRAS